MRGDRIRRGGARRRGGSVRGLSASPARAGEPRSASRVPEHLRAHPEGDLREPRLHQRALPRRQPAPAASICAPRSPTTAWSTSRRETGAGLDPRAARPARPQPAVPQPRGQDAARTSSTAPLRAMPLGPLPALIDRRARGAAPVDRDRRAARGHGRRHRRAARRLPAAAEADRDRAAAAAAAGDGRADPHAALDRRARSSEHEVCFASYYDVTDQVPEQFRGPNGTFRYKQHADPPGSAQPSPDRQPLQRRPDADTTRVWGDVQVPRRRHATAQACDPIDARRLRRRQRLRQRSADQHRLHRRQPTCPPTPASASTTPASPARRRRPTTITYAPGVYDELPLKGMIIWNSHAFNLTDEDGKLEAWLNFEFAAPEEQQFPLQRHLRRRPRLFKMNVPAFQRRRGLQHLHAAAERAALRAQLAHAPARQALAHLRRRLDAATGGPNAGAPCSPFGPDEAFQTPTSAPARPARRCCRRASATATPI